MILSTVVQEYPKMGFDSRVERRFATDLIFSKHYKSVAYLSIIKTMSAYFDGETSTTYYDSQIVLNISEFYDGKRDTN